MKTSATPFTAIFADWLDVLRSMLPGGRPDIVPREATPKEAQAAANQEWEGEGGCIKPPEKPEPSPGPKIPL